MILILSFVLMGTTFPRNLSAQTASKQSQSAQVQVPPREGVVSQRDKEKPRTCCLANTPECLECWAELREKETPLLTDTAELNFDWNVQSSAYIRFSWEPLSIEFVADDGKEAKILFTEEGVTYSGDVSFDESTKMFFDLFWKKYILKPLQ